MKKEITRKRFRLNFYFSDFIKERFIYRFFKEIKDAITLYLVTRKKENKEYLREWGFRINSVGQPFTVINLPEDIAQQERDIEPYVVLQLRKMDAIFIKLKLTEIIYPEIERIPKDNPGNTENPFEDAFLVVLCTSMETFKFWKIILHLFKYSIIVLISWILLRIFLKTGIISNAFDYIKSFLWV